MVYRIDDATAVATMPTPEAGAAEGFFSPGNGTPGTATIARASWFNRVQENLRGLLTAAGITPAKTDYTQVAGAVKRLAGANLTSLTASATLTVDQSGLVLISAAAGNVTVTLPAANAVSGVPLRYDLVRTDSSANTVTVQRAGSDTVEGLTSASLMATERLQLTSDGSSTWRATADGRWAASFAASGWQKFPNGLILQWGQTVVAAPTTVTFPIAFPTACRRVIVTEGDAAAWTSGSVTIHGVSALTTANYSGWARVWNGSSFVAGTITQSFIAIGN